MPHLRFSARSSFAPLAACAAAMLLAACANPYAERKEGDVNRGVEYIDTQPWESELNAQMREVIKAHETLGAKPITSTTTPAEARHQPTLAQAVKEVARQRGSSYYAIPEPVGSVRDIIIHSPSWDIPARVYTPSGAGPFPVVLYFHGGGWVIGDLDSYDASPRALCNAAHAIVVSADYRHAPEYPFPSAVDDAYAAYKWVLNMGVNEDERKGRIAIAGESAGGNLAAVVTQLAKERGDALPLHQLLIYPVIDYAFDSPSYTAYANAKPLNKEMMQWFWGHYLTSPMSERSDPRACPLRAADLRGLPPATIITAQVDPLLSDGNVYADALRIAAVPVELENYTGVAHEFFGMGAVVDKSREAVKFAAERLKQCFAKQR